MRWAILWRRSRSKSACINKAIKKTNKLASTRQRIAQRKAAPLKLYPEDRDAPHPTTSQVLKTFDGLFTYMLTENGHSMEQFRDPLNATQRAALALLDMSEREFWNPIF